jgi:hypothetical protein
MHVCKEPTAQCVQQRKEVGDSYKSDGGTQSIHSAHVMSTKVTKTYVYY